MSRLIYKKVAFEFGTRLKLILKSREAYKKTLDVKHGDKEMRKAGIKEGSLEKYNEGDREVVKNVLIGDQACRDVFETENIVLKDIVQRVLEVAECDNDLKMVMKKYKDIADIKALKKEEKVLQHVLIDGIRQLETELKGAFAAQAETGGRAGMKFVFKKKYKPSMLRRIIGYAFTKYMEKGEMRDYRRTKKSVEELVNLKKRIINEFGRGKDITKDFKKYMKEFNKIVKNIKHAFKASLFVFMRMMLVEDYFITIIEDESVLLRESKEQNLLPKMLAKTSIETRDRLLERLYETAYLAQKHVVFVQHRTAAAMKKVA